jgi:hypothetical protein
MRLSNLVGAVVLCAACTSVQSADIKTAGMSAFMEVSADGTGQTRATAEIHVDNNATDYVTLSSGDTLVASAGSQSQTMSQNDFLGTVGYLATFTDLDGDGTQYTIALKRTSDVSAPSSTCVMPKPFNITAPTANGTFSRSGADIMVTYDTTGTQDQMTWSAGGDCVKGMVDGTVSGDSGSFTIAKGLLVPTDASIQMMTCQAHITLTRSRPGQLDSHFGSGGNITAQQVRTVTFNSTP